MTSSITPLRPGLLVTLVLSAVAVLTAGCGGSGRVGTTKPASTTSAAANASGPPPGQDDLTGTWSGYASGAYNGTLTIIWQESGWAVTGSHGDLRSKVDGTIKLSAPSGTQSIHGTVGSACPNNPPPCYQGAPITFTTVSGAGRIIYTGTVAAPQMSGTYRTSKGSGTWNATQIG
jgi:hypothetical protein